MRNEKGKGMGMGMRMRMRRGRLRQKRSRRERDGMEKECVASGSLLDCDDGDGGVADCVGAVEGEDFVEFFADG